MNQEIVIFEGLSNFILMLSVTINSIIRNFASNYSHAKLFRIQFQDLSITTMERDINGGAYRNRF